MRPDTGGSDALWSLGRGTPTPSRLPQALTASLAEQSSADWALWAPQTTSLPVERHHRATARHTTPLTDFSQQRVACRPHAARSPARTGGGAPPPRVTPGHPNPLPHGGHPSRCAAPPWGHTGFP